MKKHAFNKTLIYDDNCPLCKAYSGAFVKTGFLASKNRVGFSEISCGSLPGSAQKITIDWQKAKHEIPLIDCTNGTVKYGIEALAEILSQKLFFIKPLLKISFSRFACKKLYGLISYNRKIIVANIHPVINQIDCSPDFHFYYRWMMTFTCSLLSFFFTTIAVKNLQLSMPNHFESFVFFMLPVLPILYTGKNKNRLADACTHVSIIGIVSTFLFMSSTFLKNISSLPQSIFIVLLCMCACVTLHQLVKRATYIIKNNIA